MSMTTKTLEPLIVERTFDASIDKVWRAITTAEAMGRWYFEMENFKPEIGCEFRFA